MQELVEIKKIEDRMICLYDQATVEQAISRVAADISSKLSNEIPLLLCVMNGAVLFMGHLVTRLDFPLQIDYVHVTRYNGEKVAGKLRWVSGPSISVADRTVIIIDDILDSGLTLSTIEKYCIEQKAKKIYSAVLVDKQCPRHPDGLQQTDFVGLIAENKFLVGYGLDYKGFLRNLSGIYIVD